MEPKTCETCHFCVEHETGASQGACHRFPPRESIDRRGRNSQFPHVYADQWCGEWKAKK